MVTFLSLFVTGAILAIAYVIFSRLSQKAVAQRHGCQLPPHYFHIDPVLGLDLKFQEIRNSLKFQRIPTTAALFKNRRTFQVNNVGNPMIRTIDPENIQAVEALKERDWGVEPLRLQVMEPFCGRGFITTDGAPWKHSRALLKSSFSGSNISDLSLFQSSLDLLIDRIPDNGTTIDLQQLFSTMFIDTATDFLLGESAGLLSTKDAKTSSSAEGFLKSFHASLFAIGLSFLAGPFQFLIPRSMKQIPWQKTHEYVDAYITKALEEQKLSDEHKPSRAAHSLLGGLVQQTDDRTEIRNQILQGMMAAQDTTSVLLSNTIFLLSRSPKSWDKLRQEVLSHGEVLWRPDTLKALKYLNKVLKESLRLYPVFPIMDRKAVRDTILPRGGGTGQHPIYVKQGTTVVMHFYALHRDPDVFGPDVESYNPDRWDSINPGQFEYMVFGGGSRTCVGQHKAIAEASLTLVRLAQRFRNLHSQDSRPWTGQVKLTARNANGCKVAFS